jgi:hypothetical protein
MSDFDYYMNDRTKEQLIEELLDLKDEVDTLKDEIYNIEYPRDEEDYHAEKVLLDKYKDTIKDLYLLKINGLQALFESALSEFFFDVICKRP